MYQDNQTLCKLRNMASIYLTCGDKILLLYRQGSRVVNDVWIGAAGGHFEKEELNDAKACAMRELKEEMHITEDMIDNLALRYITLRRVSGEIRQNYYFFAELRNGNELELSSVEGTLKWFSLDELAELKMPYSAKYAIEHWVKMGRYTTAVYGGIANEQRGVVFTELSDF